MTKRHAGCHGIGITPEELGLDLGWLEEQPPLSVHVEVADDVPRAPDAELVWELTEPPGFGLPAITSQTWQERDGHWVGNTLNMSLRIDYGRNTITVASKGGNRQVILEALASIALPMVAQRNGFLVLHASAAASGGKAVMLCAQSGSGKSSLLMGLSAAGWDAVSEDQCSIEIMSAPAARIWPGPSWVRLKHGSPPPALVADRAPRFEALDKVGWDLGDRVAHAPARLSRIVLLEPPGGGDVVWERLPEPAVIGGLLRQATWMKRQDEYAATVLPALAKLAMDVEGFRMRVPRRPDWLEHAVALIAEH